MAERRIKAFDSAEYKDGTEQDLVNAFTAVHGSPVEFVKELGNNRSIWVVGGNTILAPLLDQNMVDYLIVQVAPVLLGAGIPLFTQKETLRRYRLETVRQYGQFAELVYCRI